MSGWKCAQCGQPSGYQGHFMRLPDGSDGFECGPVPVKGSDNWKDDELLRLRALIDRGENAEALKLVDELRMLI